MFSKVLFGIILAMGLGGYVYFKTTQGTIQELQAQLQTQAGVISHSKLDRRNKSVLSKHFRLI